MQEINQTPERWYSTKEICNHLGVSRDTLLTWIADKGLPAHKVGRNWKFNRAGTGSVHGRCQADVKGGEQV